MSNYQQTGYATIDRPWQKFYENIVRRDMLINTTPYIGLVQNNKNFSKEVAIEYFGSKVTFGELIDNIDVVAKSLVAYGVKRGDYVTICSTTTPEVVYAFYALSKIGAVANVISPFYEPEELLARTNECKSKIIIMVDKFVPKFKTELNKSKDMIIVVLPMMGSTMLRFVTKGYKADKMQNEVSWKQFIKDGKKISEVATDPYEPLKPQAMVYSSGTTGASKGIVLSVDSFQKLLNAYGNSGFDVSRKQAGFQNIPPWHSTGLSLGINFPLQFGIKMCTDPRFNHEIFIKNVIKYQPQIILTNTSMYQGFTFDKCQKLLKGKTLEFLKYPFEGGEPLTNKDIKNIEEVFRTHGSEARLLNGYGECECGATITTDITGHKFSNDASGIPLPDIIVVGIFDDDYNELKYGERGNVIVKTEIGMIEYYNNPKATQEFFHIDAEGNRWSITGDIGYMNEDGSLVVLGRKSDFSVINGVKLYNFDVERAVLKSEKVKLCEVQTHPDDSNKLVAHIVWKNEISDLLKRQADKQKDFLVELQEIVKREIKEKESIPTCFCVKDSFPSAHSGKRDIKFIKNDITGIIEL